VDADYASQIADLEGRVRKLEEYVQAEQRIPAVSQGKRLSAKEFLLTKSVKTDTQRVIAFAYYLERQEGLAYFNVADLEAVFRAAREQVPKNLNDGVNKNIARGFLMEAKEKKDAKKAWQLTSTGERFVENDLK
jgi:hypothetical protein